MTFIKILESSDSYTGINLANKLSFYKKQVMFIKNGNIISSVSNNFDTIIVSSDNQSDDSNINWDIIIHCGIVSKNKNNIYGKIGIISEDMNCNANFYTNEVISCGMSSKNTITLSSITQNHCVLALQREIMTLDGKIIAPREISVIPSKDMLNEAMIVSAGIMSVGICPQVIEI